MIIILQMPELVLSRDMQVSGSEEGFHFLNDYLAKKYQMEEVAIHTTQVSEDQLVCLQGGSRKKSSLVTAALMNCTYVFLVKYSADMKQALREWQMQ